MHSIISTKVYHWQRNRLICLLRKVLILCCYEGLIYRSKFCHFTEYRAYKMTLHDTLQRAEGVHFVVAHT